MKALWITNILFPEVNAKLLGEKDLKSSGGWMLGAANALLQTNNVELFVASVSTKVKTLTKLQGARINYYILPYGKGNNKINEEYNPYWKKIKSEVNPDIVHIHGTEFSHGLAYIKSCGSDNVVISIQGLVSVYFYYYLAGISNLEILKSITLRDIIRGGIKSGQKSFARRGKYEKELISNVKYVIGRTSWDKAHVWAINPYAKYFFCNETFRDEFYNGSSWIYDKCRKHSIFITQAGYPIKGFHQVLKAMLLVLHVFPDATIRVAGCDITRSSGIKGILHYTGYGKYIKRLIRKYHLEEIVTFVGNLNAEQMHQEYLKANLFICPSSIENSPNSLGEAQILGVPCLASYVGGVMDMMKGNEDNLYRFEEVEMLAKKVCKIFTDKEKQVDMRKVAFNRHDAKANCDQLYSIYCSIAHK